MFDFILTVNLEERKYLSLNGVAHHGLRDNVFHRPHSTFFIFVVIQLLIDDSTVTFR